MKVIILASSIFYILGLKISNKIDLVKRSSPVQKVIMHTVKPENNAKTIEFKDAEAETEETETAVKAEKCEAVEQ